MEPNQFYYKYHNQTKIKCNLTYFAIYHFVKDREIRRKKNQNMQNKCTCTYILHNIYFMHNIDLIQQANLKSLRGLDDQILPIRSTIELYI